MIQDRKLRLSNDSKTALIKNKTLMDYRVKFITDKEKLYNINYVWRYKIVYLPVELVRLIGKGITDCYVKDEEMSLIEWKNIILPPTNPTKVQYKHWK